MADTTFTQATLTQIEAVITEAISKPKDAIKGVINLDEGGQIQYRSFDELVEMRKNIKAILDSESDIDLGASKKTAYRPFSLDVVHRGNL